MATDPEHVGDASDEVEDMEDEEVTVCGGDINAQLLRRPDILAALQGRLNTEMVQVSFQTWHLGLELFIDYFKENIKARYRKENTIHVVIVSGRACSVLETGNRSLILTSLRSR